MANSQSSPAGDSYNISGGMVNVHGDNPSFTQHNHYGTDAALDRFRQLLQTIEQRLSDFSDVDAARGQVGVIEDSLQRRDPADRKKVESALTRLAALTVAGTALMDAIKKAIDLVVSSWPF
ncbi:hypothetical protein AB0J90_24650 [Micromonospora sp. NPDC049523]|uniref:hypothetical protein n=1 Tax=Micromonospora sp. NPDC049523 TaxID=3155921 RepID=UPI003419F799